MTEEEKEPLTMEDLFNYDGSRRIGDDEKLQGHHFIRMIIESTLEMGNSLLAKLGDEPLNKQAGEE